MPDINAAIFGVIVAIVVGAMVLAPRMKDRGKKPTVHDMYFNEAPRTERPMHLESMVAPPLPAQPQDAQATGAPRAPSPARQAPVGQAPTAAANAAQQGAPQPLKLPY